MGFCEIICGDLGRYEKKKKKLTTLVFKAVVVTKRIKKKERRSSPPFLSTYLPTYVPTLFVRCCCNCCCRCCFHLILLSLDLNHTYTNISFSILMSVDPYSFVYKTINSHKNKSPLNHLQSIYTSTFPQSN